MVNLHGLFNIWYLLSYVIHSCKLSTYLVTILHSNNGRFYTIVSLSFWTNLGKHFVVRLVIRLWYKDQHKAHYASGRTSFRSASFKTYFERKFFQAHKASGARLYTWEAYPDQLQNGSPNSSRRIYVLQYKNGQCTTRKNLGRLLASMTEP